MTDRHTQTHTDTQTHTHTQVDTCNTHTHTHTHTQTAGWGLADYFSLRPDRQAIKHRQSSAVKPLHREPISHPLRDHKTASLCARFQDHRLLFFNFSQISLADSHSQSSSPDNRLQETTQTKSARRQKQDRTVGGTGLIRPCVT